MDERAIKAGREARDWVVRMNSGRVSEAELARFKAWRDASDDHRRAFQHERAFWAQLQKLEPTGPAAAPIGRRHFLAGGAAAMAGVAGIIVAPRLAVAWQADVSTGIGQMTTLALPDGGTATLNTDSALAVDFDGNQRAVRLLKGEAEFTVPHAAAPFRVNARQGLAQTQQARFAVRLERDRAVVTAFQGRLGVTAGAARTTVSLSPGQQTSYGRDTAPLAPLAIDTELAEAWRSGRIIFEGRPFAQAIHELARYVPERVVIAPGVDGAIPVSGVFSTDQALAALDALARTQGLAARRMPRVMILIG